MKLFISSTFLDLREEREKLHKALSKAGLDSIGMEFFVAEPLTPKEVCLREITNSNLVLLIITDNYGTKDVETGKSYTHLEFDEAIRAKIDILAFLQKKPTNLDVQRFHAEVKKSGITVDEFDSISEIWTVLFPALIKYVLSNGLIPNKTRTFNDFVQFYARTSQKDSLFNYSQQLVGRQEELRHLESFLSDATKQTILISAAGGIGKSKLIYEFAQQQLTLSDWNFRFVPWQVGFENDSIRELPAQKTCIIIEDAHKQKSLDAIIYSLTTSFPYDVKIIISTRPSKIDEISESLREFNPTPPIRLKPLTPDDSIQLSKSILKNEKQQYAKAVCRHANGNTLVIVIASELIQSDLLDGTLINDGIFRDKVLDKLYAEIKRIDNRNIDLATLLATIAALSPVNYDDNTITLLSQLLNTQRHNLENILDDLQKNGFIVRIGNRLRVVPDILADYILYNNSVNSAKEPKDFIDMLLARFGKDYLGNLLLNAAELEFQARDNSIDLTNNIWTIINDRIEHCSSEELCSILATIEPVSYFSPDKVYGIASYILKDKLPILIRASTQPDLYELNRIAHFIIKMLSTLAGHTKFTKIACLELWDIVSEKEYSNLFDNFSESPSSAFKKLVSFDNNNPFSVQSEAMEAVRQIIVSKKHVSHERELSEIIESALKPEIENNSCSRRTFSFGFFCTYDITKTAILEKVISARNKAFELYAILIETNNNSCALIPIVTNLIQKLREPYLKTHNVSDKAKIEFEREAAIAAGLIKKIIAKDIHLLNNYIFELISHNEERLLGNIKADCIISECMKSDYELFYCIRHDWPQDYSGDHDADEKHFNEMQEHAALLLWDRCDNNPETLVDFVENYRHLLDQNGIPHDNYAFLMTCARIKPALCPKAIEIIVKKNSIDYVSSMIGVWLQFSPENQQYNLSKWVLSHGNSCHKASLARSLIQFSGLIESELVEIIECLSKDTDPETVDATIRGLGILCNRRKVTESLPRIINIMCTYNTQDDQNKLEMLLDNFNPHWISPENLSDTQLSLLLDKIKHVKKLDSHHDTGEFLSYIVTKRPLECVKLFFLRIQNMSSDGQQAFPYNEGFHSKPENIVLHSEYGRCIFEILTAMKEYNWETYFWCPTLVRWLDPLFTDVTKQILLNNFRLHPNALNAVTHIFVRYESEFFFTNIDFVNKILIHSSDPVNRKVAQSIKGQLLFMPFSGTRCVSGLGEHDSLSMDICERCNKILEDNPCFPAIIKEFYRDLIAAAEHEDRQKLARDKAELEEEEF